MLTPYQFASNSPISGVDLDGLEYYYSCDGTFIGRIGEDQNVRVVKETDVEIVRAGIEGRFKTTAHMIRDFGGPLDEPIEVEIYYGKGDADQFSVDVGMINYELNLRSTLSTIRETEGHGTPIDYNTQYGGGTFEGYEDHPREKIKKWGKTSSAAGSFQFLDRIWDEYVKKFGFEDFTPKNQDLAATALVESVKGAEKLIGEGDYGNLLSKLSGKWTSLPGGVHQWADKSKASSIFLKYRSAELQNISNIATPQGELSSPVPTDKKQTDAKEIKN